MAALLAASTTRSVISAEFRSRTVLTIFKALISVFKGGIRDPRGKDTTVDRCEVTLQDKPDDAECRLIIKMLSNRGMRKATLAHTKC